VEGEVERMTAEEEKLARLYLTEERFGFAWEVVAGPSERSPVVSPTLKTECLVSRKTPVPEPG
jgi:hypothetical protein